MSFVAAALQRGTSLEATVGVDFAYSSAAAAGEPPAFAVEGEATFKYPCMRGDVQHAQAVAKVDLSSLKLSAVAALRFYCEAAPGEALFTAEMNSTDPVEFHGKAVQVEHFRLTLG